MQVFNGNLEEDILRILFRGFPVRTTELLRVLSRRPKKVTKQGIYRVLRKLKQEEKILIFKHTVAFNNLWLFELRRVVGSMFADSIVGDIEHLRPGKNFSVHLRSLTHMDQVWAHIYTNIERTLSPKLPLYLYNPHNWTYLVRKEIDEAHVEHMSKKGRKIYLLVGGSTLLDKLIAKETFSPKYECMLHGKMPYLDYIAAIGDYIITVRLPRHGNELIDRVFCEEENVSTARERLSSLDKKISARIVIQNDAAKAKMWKRRIAKDFYVPLKYRDW